MGVVNTFNLTSSVEIKNRLRTLLREKKRRRAVNDLHFLCREVLGYRDLTNKFHREYCDFLNRDSNFKLTLTPRGSLKSSISTVGGSLQDIVRNPNTRGLIASEKFSNATKFLSEIKGHIEKNKEFITLFGDLKGSEKWTESEIIVKNRTIWKASPTITCAGIDVTKVGMHYDWIRVDDPHSDQNTTNQEQIDKVISWYRLLLSLLDPGGRLYITGTMWHYNDLYSYLISKERERKARGMNKRFIIFRRDSFKGTTEELLNNKITRKKLLWPERLSAEFLREQYLEQGPYIFSCQYRLNPIDDENATFKRSWLKTCKYEDIPPRNKMKIYTTVDPMRDEEGKDYLAIVTTGTTEDWKEYIIDIVRKKADEYDTAEEMASVYKEFRPTKIGFEATAWQKSYLKYVKMIQLLRGVRFPVTELTKNNKITKPMHIKSLVPYFRAGLIIIPTPDGTLDTAEGNFAILVDELTRYPKTANDDIIDALAYTNKLSKRPGVVKILKLLDPNSFIAIRKKTIIKNRRRKLTRLGAENVRGIR